MSSQEEWVQHLLGWPVDLRTMIYTGEEAKGLADQAVETAEASAKAEEKEPLSEDEKARLWRAVLESCSG